MEDTAPGEEVDFGRLGLIHDPDTGRRRAVSALLLVLAYSRHCFVWPTFGQTLEDVNVIAGLESAWAFFGGIPRYLVIDNCPSALTAETISLKDTRKAARDNTVKYHWRVLQLLPGTERPSYAGLRVEVLERADGELMIRYHGEAVDYQEGPPPSSALWGAASTCASGPKPQEVDDGVVNGHLNEAQRERLAALESSDEDEANDEDMATKGRGGKAKPLRHQLRRTPTETQQARWEAVQQAREHGLPLSKT